MFEILYCRVDNNILMMYLLALTNDYIINLYND